MVAVIKFATKIIIFVEIMKLDVKQMRIAYRASTVKKMFLSLIVKILMNATQRMELHQEFFIVVTMQSVRIILAASTAFVILDLKSMILGRAVQI